MSQLEASLPGLEKLFMEKETEQNWQAFANALTKISLLLKPEADLAATIPCIKKLKGPIISAIASERTTLARTAMALIKEMAINLPNFDHALADIFISHVLKNCARANNVYVTTASDAILAAIQRAKIPNSIPCLVEAISSPNKILRQNAVALLLKLVQVNTMQSLLPRILLIESAIKEAIVDRDEKVRNAAKAIFAEYSELFPDRVDSFSSNLPETAKKYLKLGLKSSTPCVTQSKRPTQRTPLHGKIFAKSVDALSVHGRKASTQSDSISPHKSPSAGSSSSTLIATREGEDQQGLSPTKSLGSLSARSKRVSVVQPGGFASPLFHSAEGISIVSAASRQSPSQKVIQSGAKRAPLQESIKKSQSTKINTGPLRIPAQADPPASVKAEKGKSLKRHTGTTPSPSIIDLNRSLSTLSLQSVDSASVVDLDVLQARVTNSDWSVRYKSFSAIESYLAHLNITRDSLASARRQCREMMEVGFSDSHPKVIQKTILCFQQYIKLCDYDSSASSPSASQDLEFLVPRFMNCVYNPLVKGKSFVQESAISCSSELFSCLNVGDRVDTLCNMLLGCISPSAGGSNDYSKNLRVRFGVVKFFSSFFGIKEYAACKNIRGILNRLGPCCADADCATHCKNIFAKILCSSGGSSAFHSLACTASVTCRKAISSLFMGRGAEFNLTGCQAIEAYAQNHLGIYPVNDAGSIDSGTPSRLPMPASKIRTFGGVKPLVFKPAIAVIGIPDGQEAMKGKEIAGPEVKVLSVLNSPGTPIAGGSSSSTPPGSNSDKAKNLIDSSFEDDCSEESIQLNDDRHIYDSIGKKKGGFILPKRMESQLDHHEIGDALQVAPHMLTDDISNASHRIQFASVSNTISPRV